MEKHSPPGKKVSESGSISNGNRRDRAAKAVGLHVDTLSKAKQVVDNGDSKLIEARPPS